jgi:hypothetical protein
MVASSFHLLARHFINSFVVGVLWCSIPLGVLGYASLRDNVRLGLPAAVIVYIAAFYWYATITLLVSYELTGERVAWRQIFRRLRGMLAVRLFVASLSTLLLWILSAIPVAVGTAWMSEEFWLVDPDKRVVAVPLIVAGLMPPLYVWTSSLFALPVVVLESVGPWKAIMRSWQLVRGYRWEVAATLIMATACYVSSNALIHAFEQSMAERDSLNVWLLAISFLAFYPWFIIVSVLLYYDLRVRKEFLNVRALELQIT